MEAATAAEAAAEAALGAPAAAEEGNADNVYIKGLPSGCTDENLMALFSQYGTVKQCRILRPVAGRMDVAALVRLSSAEEAQAAISALDGQRMSAGPSAEAGPITVRYQGKGADPPPSDNLYVKGLPLGLSEPDLRTFFGRCGTVLSCRVMPPRPPATDTTALVRFSTVEEATAAITALNGAAPPVEETTLQVKLADSRQTRDDKRQRRGGPMMTGGAEAPSAWAPQPAPPAAPGSYGGAVQGPAAAVALATSAWQPPPPPQAAAWAYGAEQFSKPLEVRFHGPKGAPPSDNLYVKGLPIGVAEADVAQLFGQCGTVLSVRVMPHRPPATDSVALVRVGSVEEAQYMVSMLNGTILDQPAAAPPPPAATWANGNGNGWDPSGSSRGYRQQAAAAGPASGPGVLTVSYHGGPRSPPSDNLYVKGLPSGISDTEVQAMFAVVGTVVSVRLLAPRPPAMDTAALVRMSSMDEAATAIQAFNGVNLEDPGMVQQQQQQQQILGMEVAVAEAMAVQQAAGLPTVIADAPAVAPGVLALEVRFHGGRGAPPSDNLYVKGMRPDITEEEVAQLFSTCGSVVKLRVMAPRPPAMDSTALVRMSSVQEAQMAIAMLNPNGVEGAELTGDTSGQHRYSPY